MRHATYLKGKTIARVEMRHFDNGRGGKATDPLIHFTDGSCIAFSVIETDAGQYGHDIIYWRDGIKKLKPQSSSKGK